MEHSIKIIRSAKRQKTVSGTLVNGVLEIRAPAGLPDNQLQSIIDNLQKQLRQQQRKRQLNQTSDLARRAGDLN